MYAHDKGPKMWACMCRDIAEAQEGRSVMSVVCCGHSPKSRIEHMAFQPDGSFLVWPLCSVPGNSFLSLPALLC